MQAEEGEKGGKGKKQKQPKLSNLFIRGFVFEHLNESCVCFSLFSICICSLLCSEISGHVVMTGLVWFYILFCYRVMATSPLPHLAVKPPTKSNLKMRGYVSKGVPSELPCSLYDYFRSDCLIQPGRNP